MQGVLFDLLEFKLPLKHVISISGPSGMGKTTLAMSLVGNLLEVPFFFNENCIWIQASEMFSKKRLKSMFEEETKKLQCLNEQIFIIPSGKPCSNYSELLSILKLISAEEILLPPNLKCIVIDNISHHLRYKISLFKEIKDTIRCLNDFFDNYLLPLILFCIRQNVYLILIHEATFNVSQGETRPFFYKLYERIDALHINFHKKNWSNIIEVKVDKESILYKYHLANCGIVLIERM